MIIFLDRERAKRRPPVIAIGGRHFRITRPGLALLVRRFYARLGTPA